MEELIKVMIVDDHMSIRNSLEREFCAENGFEVVSSIASAAFAEMECAARQPALIIMDVCTEGQASGLEAAESIVRNHPGVKVIVTSGFDEITYASRAQDMGAHAFVEKNRSLGDYRETARLVLAGGYSFPESKIIPLPNGKAPFSKREMEILRLKCKQMRNAEIAAELVISEKTVKRHIENMLHKSGFDSSVELIIYVLSNGWINPNY